jgi:hypothetical protein
MKTKKTARDGDDPERCQRRMGCDREEEEKALPQRGDF